MWGDKNIITITLSCLSGTGSILLQQVNEDSVPNQAQGVTHIELEEEKRWSPRKKLQRLNALKTFSLKGNFLIKFLLANLHSLAAPDYNK